MAATLSQHSKKLTKQALSNKGFTDEYLKTVYNVNQDQFIDMSLKSDTSDIYEAASSTLMKAGMSEEAAAENANNLADIADYIKEQAEADEQAKAIKDVADESAAKQRKEEFEKSNYKPLDAYPNEKGNEVNTPVAEKILAEYGNNYFELITYDQSIQKDNGRLRLAGVLKDVPSFSMGSTWDKGPASTISDTVKGFMCSPVMEMVTTLGGRDRSWMNLDEGTDRTYKTSSKPSFSLTFKLYTNENIGSEPFTNYKTWIKALSLYTMPSIDAKVSINSMANNALNGLYGSVDLINNVVEGAKQAFKGGEHVKDENGKDTVVIPDARDTFGKLGDALIGAANAAANQITSRDDEYRMTRTANKKNFYGAKIWYLKILPGIFKNPLIVYIPSWGVTYSKEINPDTFEPIWVEFNITCEMDQLASAPVWMKYLTGELFSVPYETQLKVDANKKKKEQEEKAKQGK